MFRPAKAMLDLPAHRHNEDIHARHRCATRQDRVNRVAGKQQLIAVRDPRTNGIGHAGINLRWIISKFIGKRRLLAAGVNALRSPERAMIVVTHYQRLLNYIVPDFVHVLVDGRIVKSGGKDLALELEDRGYGWIEEEARAEALKA